MAKILIIDDDIKSLKQAEEILKQAGFEVISVDNPKFILKVIKQEKPDVVVSDIIMPHKDGYALCEEIKELYRNKIAVILCTIQTYERELIEKAAKDFGADDYIIKPFKDEELLGKIKAILEKRARETDSTEVK